MNSPRAPLFIVFEGIDGSGTTTQSDLLVARLRQSGHDVVQSREPGGTELGERIRDLVLNPSYGQVDARAELFLCAAARSQHTRELIEPALAAGKPVICDRYAASTVAYQGGGRGIEPELVRQVNAAAVGGCDPDLTVLLDIPVDQGEERRRGRGGPADRLEQAGRGLQVRVQKAYEEQAQSCAATWLRVCATGPADELAERIYRELTDRWPDFPFRA
ncbi:dTMP kinase [Candidatus Latescibacterota bacterium]